MTGRYVRTGDIKKDASRLFLSQYGGASRSRTEVHGFAIRCIATLPTRQIILFSNILFSKTHSFQKIEDGAPGRT